MIETIGPIVDSIENNLYVGRYDFTESSPPTGNLSFKVNHKRKLSIKYFFTFNLYYSAPKNLIFRNFLPK